MLHIARPGETISSVKHESRVGGKGANQAVAIVRAGGKAKFYGVAGKDGQWLKEKLEEWGVEVDKLLVSQVGFRTTAQSKAHGCTDLSRLGAKRSSYHSNRSGRRK